MMSNKIIPKVPNLLGSNLLEGKGEGTKASLAGSVCLGDFLSGCYRWWLCIHYSNISFGPWCQLSLFTLLFHLDLKLRDYTQIAQAVLLHRSASQRDTKIQNLPPHCKAIRHIFQVENPYFHRVLWPTDSPCSNKYLLSLSYPVLPSCVFLTPVSNISDTF